MDKRMFSLGLLIFIAGIVVAFISVQSVISGIPNYSNSQSIAVKPGSDFFVPIYIANESVLQILYNSTQPMDFFLMNSTARNLLPSNTGLIENASYLQGNGLIYEIDNSTHGIFPDIVNISLAKTPTYWKDNQTIVTNGTYYMVFQNYGNKSNTVFYTTLNRSISSLSNSEQNYSYGIAAMNIFSVLAVLAGIVLMFYSLFMTPKKIEEAQNEEAERMYSSLERKHVARHRVRKKNPKKKRSRK